MLGIEASKDGNAELNERLKHIAESELIQSNTEDLENLQKHEAYVVGLLHKFSALKIWSNFNLKVAKFGSTVSGFASRNTDCDLTILTNCYIG